MSCRCEAPTDSPNPRNAGQCARCGRPFDPARLDSRENIRAFFDWLARAIFPPTRTERGMEVLPTQQFEAIRYQAETRWEEGRGKFGKRYLARDNNAEGREELADAVNYGLSDVLQYGGLDGDADIDLALQEAFYVFKAYECNLQRSARRRGSP